MLTRAGFWKRTLIGTLGALGLASGFVLAERDALLAIALLTVGLWSWRLSTPEPATRGDIALLTTDARLAKALAVEHDTRRSWLWGVLIGVLTTLLIIAALRF